MEKSLDDIANGKLEYKDYLKKFLSCFEEKLYGLVAITNNEQKQEKYGVCPKCQNDTFLCETKNNKFVEKCSTSK